MDSKETYYSLDELAEELYVVVEEVSKYLKKNKFPNAFKLAPHKGGWHIPQKDVIDFKKKDEKYKRVKKNIDILRKSEEEYLTVKQVAETLNKTEQTVRKYIKNKVFPNILSLPSKRGGYYIPNSDLEEFLYKSRALKSFLWL